MKKPASKVAELAQIQPKSQFLFHKNLPPRDFSIMTLLFSSGIKARHQNIWVFLIRTNILVSLKRCGHIIWPLYFGMTVLTCKASRDAASCFSCLESKHEIRVFLIRTNILVSLKFGHIIWPLYFGMCVLTRKASRAAAYCFSHLESKHTIRTLELFWSEAIYVLVCIFK